MKLAVGLILFFNQTVDKVYCLIAPCGGTAQAALPPEKAVQY